ncbi:hypothetical protein N7490_006274 [Penicillium lividum]|nr:hypothetical protein N7490_006274 [Penicillium lividum]
MDMTKPFDFSRSKSKKASSSGLAFVDEDIIYKPYIGATTDILSPILFSKEVLRLLQSTQMVEHIPAKDTKDKGSQKLNLNTVIEITDIILGIVFNGEQVRAGGKCLSTRVAISDSRFQQVPGRAAIKRHVQVMLVDLVKQGRYSTQNLGNILHRELQRHHPAYCRALSALPLVIKYMPKAIKKSLTAKAKSKNLKLAVRLLKRWGLSNSLMA